MRRPTPGRPRCRPGRLRALRYRHGLPLLPRTRLPHAVIGGITAALGYAVGAPLGAALVLIVMIVRVVHMASRQVVNILNMDGSYPL
ncbi:hypothetical protein ACFY12_29970 [Streptomyces sp. NPDC001339]|uniref:hypothetical protein n=1 Tax=Streptomyces sp. NPDC001339 TaxID=3364563 RepID=UPI0036801E8E